MGRVHLGQGFETFFRYALETLSSFAFAAPEASSHVCPTCANSLHDTQKSIAHVEDGQRATKVSLEYPLVQVLHLGHITITSDVESFFETCRKASI
jgi:hypothetical protein